MSVTFSGQAPGRGPNTLRAMDDDVARMTAPALPLLTTAGTLELGGRPWLMGVVNATPDSFSDAGGEPDARRAG